MPDKSITASERLETGIMGPYQRTFNDDLAYNRHMSMSHPAYKPNNAPASGINPQDSTETAII